MFWTPRIHLIPKKLPFKRLLVPLLFFLFLFLAWKLQTTRADYNPRSLLACNALNIL